MSYGNVYIKNDIIRLKRAGMDKAEIIQEIAQRIVERYSDISMRQARRIAGRGYSAKGYEWNWN